MANAEGGGSAGGDLEGFEDLAPLIIERIPLNGTDEGRAIAAAFVEMFGDFVTTHVRPILVEVAKDGEEPQLLVNGLAELLRATADSIEFPIDHPRAGSPNRRADGTP